MFCFPPHSFSLSGSPPQTPCLFRISPSHTPIRLLILYPSTFYFFLTLLLLFPLVFFPLLFSANKVPLFLFFFVLWESVRARQELRATLCLKQKATPFPPGGGPPGPPHSSSEGGRAKKLAHFFESDFSSTLFGTLGGLFFPSTLVCWGLWNPSTFLSLFFSCLFSCGILVLLLPPCAHHTPSFDASYRPSLNPL